MHTKDWLLSLLDKRTKPAIPVLSFPCVSLMGITVNDLIHSSDLQAEGMVRVAKRVPSGASVSMMDLSVEAEAFGSSIRYDEQEVPAVTNIIVHDEDEARALSVPSVGAGRTGLYVEAIRKAAAAISDRPVFAGIIGPFSLAGRLVGVSEAMLYCYDEPDMMQIVLDKVAEFLTNYALAYKKIGAAGIVMAEPLAGLLSPAQAKTFSHPYVKRIIDAVQDENFLVIYHNCGESAAKMVGDLVLLGASAYHFGNKVDLLEVLKQMPADVITMGNVDPAGQFKNGTPESIAEETKQLLERCSKYSNFVISSGCDIPPAAPWENIEAFFAAVTEFYQK
jgi:uroporphyrinogen decarboxylase